MKVPKTKMLNQRSLEIFKHIVDAYVATGEPIGSHKLVEQLGLTLSPATIRNVMARLEEAGLLYAPHTSAGRMPTEAGLRFFVDGILEIGDLSESERVSIQDECTRQGYSIEQVLTKVSQTLSGLSECAGLVMAPKTETTLKHVEFLYLEPGRGLVILIAEDNTVENRIINLPLGLPQSALIEASNYLNARLRGGSLSAVKNQILHELTTHQGELDQTVCRLVEEGLADWVKFEETSSLIVHGQSNLLKNVNHVKDLERIKNIFSLLETKESLLNLLEAAIDGDGVQIFIGAESDLFRLSGCSLVVAPYKNLHGEIIGSVGVIGPSRINYRRIIPMVDYTAKIISNFIR